ncbi:MAG TPA: hypothetical protein HPP41_00065 [Deltaproteobacteria bacterium]|nr:hypothetical protein [Deltaproteobacteria bacterium]
MAEEKEIGESAESPKGPVGLDIGTTHIVVAQDKRNHIRSIKQLNAFFTVPKSKFSKSILNKKEVMYYEQANTFCVIGYSAENFANMFNMDSRKPIKEGLLSSTEEEGLSVIQAIVNTLIEKPKTFGEAICFSIPGEPLDGTGSVVYHESVIKRFLGSMGYSPVSINEGMAIVVSELSDDDYTGIGISMGGGMCNVCLSYLSFPVITYGIQIAGDYIDSMVGEAVGEPATKIKGIKEGDLDLSKEPKDRIMTALHIFYDELIFKLLQSLQRVLTSTDKIPKISSPIPIVLSGGTAMPYGCKEKFEKALKNIQLPVEISSVRLAEDPLNTPAKGALIMAMTEAG